MVRARFFTGLPLINFCIAGAAISFQVGVLYPWHHILSADIKGLQYKIESLEKTISASSVDVAALQRKAAGSNRSKDL